MDNIEVEIIERESENIVAEEIPLEIVYEDEDIIIVKSGEKIPLDGEVIKGNAEINNSALTGESRLVAVKKGDKVLSGGINSDGLIEIRVEKTYEDSTVSQILNLVEQMFSNLHSKNQNLFHL